MDPWTIIGWFFVIFIGGALATLVVGFAVSLLIEGVRTARHQQRVESNLRRHVG